ncbi:MAG: TIGR00300 family protein, partial [Methanobacteriales archaeon HGW-Methanobacteriales-2]
MYNREVKLTGHIIDSLTLPRALDLIMDMGGDFQILEFEVGKRKKDTSRARIKVSADSESLLGEILDELAEIGAMVVEIREVNLEAASKDKTLPADFYSTTNHPTFIRFQNEWIPVENIEMDC